MELQTDVLLTVIRESVSLFILLVFVFFSYRLLDRVVTILDNYFGEISGCLGRIAEALEKK